MEQERFSHQIRIFNRSYKPPKSHLKPHESHYAMPSEPETDSDTKIEEPSLKKRTRIDPRPITPAALDSFGIRAKFRVNRVEVEEALTDKDVAALRKRTVDLLNQEKFKKKPTYLQAHWKYLSPDTLDEFDLPWEWSDNVCRRVRFALLGKADATAESQVYCYQVLA